ncbi:MAG: hypothetical protein SFU56_13085 [Capsulimonadales bacterium]|nr:hypothetical protein [Capsulimonadales bacterium]
MKTRPFIGSPIPSLIANPVVAEEGSLQESAGSLPPLLAGVPKRPVAARTIAEFPAGTFLENIVTDRDGVLWITDYEAGKILRIAPNGKTAEFADLGGKIAGIARDRAGNLIVGGWADGKTPTIFRVARNARVERLAAPDGVVFPNGIARLSGDRFLIADSYRGVIWQFDAATRKTSIWLEDALLTRVSSENPVPGANGLKIFREVLYVTNTQRQEILRVPLRGDGHPGKVSVWVKRINGDDFAPDIRGNLYVTTHFYNSVIRVAPNGRMTILADASAGLRGATALAFGRTVRDRTAAYVVTNGGVTLPGSEGPESARVVRLEIGVPGAAV